MPMFPTVDEDGLPTKGTSGTPGGFTGGGGGPTLNANGGFGTQSYGP